jgi:nucleotide-binding universal stress UspA family protein
MNERILVPLDGSVLAEKALPYAIGLAQHLEADLLLMRVVQTGTLVRETVIHEIEVLDSAKHYLEKVRETITNPAYAAAISRRGVHIRAVYGDAVDRLLDLIPFEKADLVVMTTHARAGLSRLALGSVATELVRRLAQPVILIRPTEAEQDVPLAQIMSQPQSNWPVVGLPERILLTLDGSPEAEVVLKPAAKLARLLQATLFLLRVEYVYTSTDYILLTSYYAGSDVPDLGKENHRRRQEAYWYLDDVETRLNEPDLKVIPGVRTGEPAREIVSYARQIKADLVVMATHARGRVGHALLGSVAEEVLRTSHIPVMMLHTSLAVSTAEKSDQAPVN